MRAGLVGRARQYPWSSARAHLEERDPDGLLDLSALSEVRGFERWSERIGEAVGPQEAQRLRAATRTGAPLGDAEFVRPLERRFGRALELRGPGRPAKSKAAAA